MSIVFAERNPSDSELEKLRLIMSTFLDGSGMLALKEKEASWISRNNVKSLPGWRDFERAVAVAYNGTTAESKAFYDVLIPDPSNPGQNFGISCKMRQELKQAKRKGIVYVEIANASNDFWAAIKSQGYNETTFHTNPAVAGSAILNLVKHWHEVVSIENGGSANTSKSSYLILQYDRSTGEYQLFQYPIILPDPTKLDWKIRTSKAKKKTLLGFDTDNDKLIFEWYGFAGGQLKYFPDVSDAKWSSPIFFLEPLPFNIVEDFLLEKVGRFFPTQWAAIHQNEPVT